ncbi:MAG: hypothetical protein HY680_04765 [Chloroflexi bacterium]|nr:hypothetical protein [Chloroflexota bacterium]
MPIARQSVVHPKANMAQRVATVLDELEAAYAALPGYILGFRYRPHGVSGELGRIAVWASQQDADRAAQNTHIIAIRARLTRIIEGEHEEHIFDIEGTPQKLPRV